MGWYTTGPGSLEYKAGDVVELWTGSRLGRLTATPRLAATGDDDELLELDELEFLAPLQQQLVRRRLPWKRIAFSKQDREALVVRHGTSIERLLDQLAERIDRHHESVRTVIAKSIEDAPEVVALEVSIDLTWSLSKRQYAELVGWINASLGRRAARVTLDGLRAGTLDDTGWYLPPQRLAATFEALSRDAPRDLAVHGLAHALLADEELELDQPDDVWRRTAWTLADQEDEEDDDDEADSRVLVFCPEREPFLRLLGESLRIPRYVMRRTFYLSDMRAPHVDELLPGPDPSDAEEKHADRLIDYLFGLFGRSFLETGEPAIGWHLSASPDELERAFAEAGFDVWSFARLMAGKTERASGKSIRERLRSVKKAFVWPDERDAFQSVFGTSAQRKRLRARKDPPFSMRVLRMLMAAVDLRELSTLERKRLAALMKTTEIEV